MAQFKPFLDLDFRKLDLSKVARGLATKGVGYRDVSPTKLQRGSDLSPSLTLKLFVPSWITSLLPGETPSEINTWSELAGGGGLAAQHPLGKVA